MDQLILTPLSVEQLQNMVADAVKIGIEQFKPSEQTNGNLLTRKQVCHLLNITPPTLHEWVRNGTLAAYKVGTRVRFKENEVLSTLQRIQRTKNRGV
jgi:excisionase family DNA binding protein